jgi:hypothetical protein
VEVPIATEVGIALEAIGIEAELEQVLQGGQAMGPGPHHSPGAPAVHDITHGPSILGCRRVGKPGGRTKENHRFQGKSGESR